MMSKIIKRSIVIGDRKTSVSLEDEFWKALKEIAGGANQTIGDFVARVEVAPGGNLSSAIRLAVLAHYKGAKNAPAA